MPSNKQVVLVSATYPESLVRFSERYMREMSSVRLVENKTASLVGIKQFHTFIDFHPIDSNLFEQKVQFLLKILPQLKFRQCLIFSNFRLRSSAVCERLKNLGFQSTFTSGGLAQQRRSKAMRQMYKHQCQVLVTTDLTSRGLDFDSVDFVVSMDLPAESETYLHRIGRAGRFGAFGSSLTIVARGDEQESFRKIQQDFQLNSIEIQQNLCELPLLIESLEKIQIASNE